MLAITAVLALDTSDTGGVLVPLAIIGGCVAIIVVSVLVRWAKRRRRASLDQPAEVAADPHASTPDRGATDWNEAPTDLGSWQTTHGHSVDQWLDAHEGSLPALVPGADPEIDAELDKAMSDAAAVCPNPEVAGMLAGMRETAKATRAALTGNDRPAAEAAHEEYGRHRAAAIDALQPPAAPPSD